VKRYWSDDVLDRAIAVDWLLIRCGRADEALLGLWLAGYPVGATEAKRAWIQQIKRVQRRRQRAAARYGTGFFGLARGWWRKLCSTDTFYMHWWRERPSSDREALADFVADTQEWLRDDINRDDESYRNQIAELIIRLAGADREGVYAVIDRTWKTLDPVSIFAITPSIEFVESMPLQELEAAQKSVAAVASMLSHAMQLGGPTDRIPRVIAPLALMQGFLGALVVKTLFVAKEMRPRVPAAESISTLHEFVMRVQYTDIAKKNDGSVLFSGRVRIEWETTKKKLSQLWIAAKENSEKLPETSNGPRERASG
jgi:hypothetical protein